MNIPINSRYTENEEKANAVSHFIAFLLAIAGLVFLVIKSARIGTGWHIVSSSIFGASMIILYLSSSLTHWLKPGRAKVFFFTLDQVAIFLLIAGTYTPLTLVALNGPFGWVLFGLEWGLAIIGITIKILRPTQFNKGVNLFYILLYAAMGWMLLIAIVPIFRNIPVAGVIWILVGGLFYTFGIFLYRKGKFKYHHLIWHMMVMAGTASHFIGIYKFVLPIV